MAQRGQNAHRGVHAGEQVGHGHAHLLRAAAQVVALAGDAHQPAHALDGVVVAGARRIRPGLAKAGEAAVDEARVDGLQAVVIQPVARHVAHLEVLDEHLAVLGQRADQRLALGPGDVAGHAALVAVGAQVVGGLVRLAAVVGRQKGRAPGARVVAGAGALDLDHVGPQVGQGLGTPGAGQHAGQVKDADAVKCVHGCILAKARAMIGCGSGRARDETSRRHQR